MRHGKAYPSQVDPKRALSRGGRQEVKLQAETLRSLDIQAPIILHSSKLRAKQTAQILYEKLGDAQLSEVGFLEPNSPPQKVYDQIKAMQTDVMLVGHLPLVNLLVSYMVGVDEQLIEFSEATIICLKNIGGAWLISQVLSPA